MKKPLSKILEEARVAYRDGKKLRAVMEADPNFRAYVDSGASTKVARLVSMSYIMASVFDEYTENAAGLMEKYGFLHKKTKTTSNNLSQSFDAFDKAISALVNTEEAKQQLCSDYEIFKAVCDKFMNADVRVDDTRRTGTMKKSVLIDHIHAMQDNLALNRIATYSADWVIGMLSQIAQDVANIEPEGEETDNTTDNDKQGI